MKLKSPHLIKPGQKVRLSHIPSSARSGDKKEEQAQLEHHRLQLQTLQEVLYAEQKHAVLIVLQGMDTAGKDGTISHIFTGVNPQGCDITSFKVPSALEARHDFLWRAHNAVPPRGMIGIFNRSHYEDVLSPRVHNFISQKEVRRRLQDINRFEEVLQDNNVTILKFFLHISYGEQGRRLQARIADPDKHWKLSEADFHERRFWAAYTRAYQDVFEHTSRKRAPWFVVPANDKDYRNLAISQILVETMKALKMEYPRPSVDPKTLTLD